MSTAIPLKRRPESLRPNLLPGSPDWKAIQRPVLLSSLVVATVVALITAGFSLIGYRDERDRLQELNGRFVATILNSMRTFDYSNVKLLSDSHLEHLANVYVLAVDQVGYEIYGNRKGYQTALTTPRRTSVARTTEHPLPCLGPERPCGVYVVYEIRSLWVILFFTAAMSLCSFLIVFLAMVLVFDHYIRQYVRKPIADLSQAMRETLTTKQFIQSPHISDTELGALTETFNLMQTELHQSLTKLEQARRMEAIGTITSGVAHEFNNLLAVMLGNLDLLDNARDLTADHREHLADIEVAVHNATMIVDKLLTYSRDPGSGPERNVDIADILENVRSLTRPFLEDVSLDYHNHCPDRRIRTSPGLESALVNLIKNSCEAMGGRGRISIEIRPARSGETGGKPGDFIAIDVIDDGPGIPPDLRAHLFDPFFTTKPAGRGVGLGLWIVFNCAKGLGGSVSYRPVSTARGSVFTLLLPVRETDAMATPASSLPAPGDTDTLAGRTMLILEDEDSLLRIYVSYFRSLGAHVEEARTVTEAVRILDNRAARIDIVLSDLHLPDGKGISVLQHARRISPRILTVLLSGNVELTESELAAADIVMLKPVKLADLSHKCANRHRNHALCGDRPHNPA